MVICGRSFYNLITLDKCMREEANAALLILSFKVSKLTGFLHLSKDAVVELNRLCSTTELARQVNEINASRHSKKHSLFI